VENTITVISKKNNELNSFWLKGGSILISFLSFASLIGLIFLLSAGLYLENLYENTESAEETCNNDQNPEICEEEVNLILQDLEEFVELKLWDIGAALSGLLFITSIPLVLTLWSSENPDLAIKSSWLWISLHATSQLFIMNEYNNWSKQFLNEKFADVQSFFQIFETIFSFAGIICCEFFLFSILAVITYQVRPKTELKLEDAIINENGED